MRNILQMTVISIKLDQKNMLAEERRETTATVHPPLPERELAPENEVPGNHLMFLLIVKGLCPSGSHYCRVSYLQHL